MSDIQDYMLEIRGIEKACPRCKGSGVELYGSTATWRRGVVAGQAMTNDVCDSCWGSGDADRPWADLRALEKELHRLRELESRSSTAADGVVVCLGDRVWSRLTVGERRLEFARVVGIDLGFDGRFIFKLSYADRMWEAMGSECWSVKAAAKGEAE